MDKTKRSRRSDCPISYSLDLLGDSWSLLIIRDIVFADKKTFGEFLASDEGIARNILTNRLTTLVQKGILTKQPHPSDKRKDLYQLTEAGLDLIPVLLDLSLWGAKHEPETSEAQAWLANVQADKDTLVQLIRETVKDGGSVFTGPDSVIEKLERLEKME
ncbi:helix-turn-helix transcriptional regulator [Alkalihalobacillus oceani]|uniref:winged helix-turn-helix transcriptional regulator n=1 Tax=Halalkalibacter oceani TaxID=1653776 RepID=UPI00203BD4F6|nr:helix-turn-helix domain-containing protein [Halalkalibacter oceani]MCM3762515.1 helix-turn-helix transcriptional regulator [Halalkalibacter oceani]